MSTLLRQLSPAEFESSKGPRGKEPVTAVQIQLPRVLLTLINALEL